MLLIHLQSLKCKNLQVPPTQPTAEFNSNFLKKKSLTDLFKF